MAKRLFDIFFSSLGLMVCAPFFLCAALWIKADSHGPIFFLQERVGRHGRIFRIIKFRTMIVDAEARGLKLTVGKDERITRSGRLLRKYKLDEFPQLLNVLKGEMSLVGPRPEVPEFVNEYPEAARRIVLSVLPGLTDYAALEFRDENELLARSANPRQEYIESILPMKIQLYLKYVREQSLVLDSYLIVKTVFRIFL